MENERIGGGHPITKGASNFHLDDEIYYDMDISPDVRVLATAYTPNVKEGRKAADGGQANIYDIQPQMWTYERTAEGGTQPYRAFVTIPGHLYSTFELPQYRAILLRGISWAAHHQNLDEYCQQEELDALTYPPGGPSRPADELAKLEVHPDFKMTLVASEPLITKPICLDWIPQAGCGWRSRRSIPMDAAGCARIIAARSGRITAASTPTPASSSARDSTRSASLPRAKATA
ncbi:MAG: ThuA domain-containing protein [Chthoniobacter sp.]